MRLRWAALGVAVSLWLGCGTSGGVDGEKAASDGADLGVVPSGSSAIFFVENALWADLHYRISGGPERNVRMAVTDHHNEYVVGNLSDGTVIDYNFTYYDLACPCAHDSPIARYVHGGGPTPPIDAGVPGSPDAAPTGLSPYPVPVIPEGPTTGGGDQSGSVLPLYTSDTPLEPATVIDTPAALITRVGDRVRDRHARESEFHIYDHFLPLYFRGRTYSLEIVDKVARGGTEIVMNLHTSYPQDSPDARAFFRGLNTPAEYFYNADFTQVSDSLYTTTVTFNAKEGRAIRAGDRMEMEIGIFLRQPVEGRFNYYSTAWLYVVGSGGIVPFHGVGPTLDSFPLPDLALLGGRTTLSYPYSNEPDKRFMQMATNLAPASAQPWVEGRRLLHTSFADGTHSEPGNPVFTERAASLGPRFIAPSCVSCHVRNGRGLPPPVATTLTGATVKVGEVSGSVVTGHPQLGVTIQPSGAADAVPQLAGWTTQTGHLGDGTPFELRRPRYAGTGPIPSHYSVRITPPLVGLGLLEAVAESTVAARVDVDDRDGDGISGRMQVVTEAGSGQTRMGRFGWKAGQPSLRQQIAAALNHDMGVTTSVLPALDCGAAQSGCSGSAPPLTDAALALLVRYVALLGVPARRDVADPTALAGESLFGSAGCATCHRPTLTTSAFHPSAELRGQTIRPYTDLLLHDMGPGLADNLPEGVASGAEWRTPPLWGIGLTAGVAGGEAYLHDGRARTLTEAILWHGGEAERARNAFVAMTAAQRAALLAFLATL